MRKPPEVIAFKTAYARALNTNAAVFLSQAVFLTETIGRPTDGWFFHTKEQWEQATGLSRREQETVRKMLRQRGLLLELKRGNPFKLFFKVKIQALKYFIEEYERKATEAADAEARLKAMQHFSAPMADTSTENMAEKLPGETAELDAADMAKTDVYENDMIGADAKAVAETDIPERTEATEETGDNEQTESVPVRHSERCKEILKREKDRDISSEQSAEQFEEMWETEITREFLFHTSDGPVLFDSVSLGALAMVDKSIHIEVAIRWLAKRLLKLPNDSRPNKAAIFDWLINELYNPPSYDELPAGFWKADVTEQVS